MRSTQAGDRYNWLTAVREDGRDAAGNVRWVWRCKCGKDVTKAASYVRAGQSKTCGSRECISACTEERRAKATTQDVTAQNVKAPIEPVRTSGYIERQSPPPPPVDPLQRFRTIATALGHDADALLLEFADAWLAPIVEAHGKRPDAPVSTLSDVRQS